MLKISVLASSFIALSVASSLVLAAQGPYISAGLGHSDLIDMPSSDTYGYYNTDVETRSTAFRATTSPERSRPIRTAS